MTSPGKTVVAWAPDETRRFYRAFHKYGLSFDKVSRSVGSGRGPEQCEALHRQHQAYLSLDKKFQSEVAFIAMVQDASQHLGKAAEEDEVATQDSGLVRTATASVRDGADAESTLDGPEVKEESAKPAAERTLASTRARRTPKPSAALTPRRTVGLAPAAAARTPVSSAKRARGKGGAYGDDAYEYYGTAAELTASARKRRASGQGQRRLDFDLDSEDRGAVASSPTAAGTRQEVLGISALLALAEVEEAGGSGIAGLMAASLSAGGDEEDDETMTRSVRAYSEEEEEEEDDIADAGAIEAGDETDDGDYYLGERRRRSTGRRSNRRGSSNRGGGSSRGAATPTSTPGRRGVSGRGSYGTTPLRAREGRSPAADHQLLLSSMRSPDRGGWLAMAEADLLGGGDLSNLPDLGYLTSPGLVGAPGFAGAGPNGIPSPTNPMPRLRRRKLAPERSPPMVSPFKSLFSRRHSLAGASAAATLLGPVAALNEPGRAGAVVTPAEARLRHALAARARRWCTFEFFASALDRSWLFGGSSDALIARNDENAANNTTSPEQHAIMKMDPAPQAMLHSLLGLPGDAALTRREWNALRSGLGRPRRLSLRFLQEQRAELEAWRSGARARYASALGGISAENDGGATINTTAEGADTAIVGHPSDEATLQTSSDQQQNEASASQAGEPSGTPAPHPIDVDPRCLPLPLTVGQRVTARHPATRQLHDGSVLTMSGRAVRVQFDRRELGVELVRDVDVAPCDPAENLSTLQRDASEMASLLINGRIILNGKTVNLGHAGSPHPQTVVTGSPPGRHAGWPAVPAPEGTQPAPPEGVPQMAREGPPSGHSVASALAQLTLELQKKEALVAQMRAMNEEASTGLHTDSPGGAQNPGFVQSFAQVVLQLRAIDDRIRERMVELQALGVDGSVFGRGGTEPGVSSSVAPAPLYPPTAMAGPDPDTLASRAFDAATEFVAACRAKMEREMMTAQPNLSTERRPSVEDSTVEPESEHQEEETSQHEPTTLSMDWESGDGPRLLSFVSRCLQSVVLLNWGGTGTVPLPSLATALDLALSQLQPRAPANEPLLGEARSALAALKSQFSAAG